MALFSGLRPAPGARLTAPRQAYFAFPGASIAAVRWAAQESGRGRDVYHCAHLVRRARRRAADAAPLTSLYVDLDTERSEELLITPSLVVESSPGHRQLYYRLTQPVAPAQGAALNRRLAAALAGDPSGWDLTQLLRVPGTWNTKYADRPLVRLVEQHTVVYDPRELDAFLPQLPTPAAHPPERGRRSLRAESSEGEPPVRLTAPARAIWDGKDVVLTPDGRVDRSRSLVRIARILHQAGVAPEHLAAVLAERDASLGWRKYAARADGAAQYRRLVDLVMHGPRTQRQG